jgi:hypothetical protein
MQLIDPFGFDAKSAVLLESNNCLTRTYLIAQEH